MTDTTGAQSEARHLLAAELPRRWKHVAGVAARAEAMPLCSDEDERVLVAAAWLHDIGYAAPLVDTGFHPVDGARYLRRRGCDERVVGLVAHHSCARMEAELRGLTSVVAGEFPLDLSLPHDELCFCDMTTGPDGELVGVEERLAEIRLRYADGHVVRQFVDRAGPQLVETVRRIERQLVGQPR
jgi:HD domain